MPNTLDVEPDTFTFTTELQSEFGTMDAGMNRKQFPLISNTATTGHKLQGCTAASLFAIEWKYQQNWAYVVLSRVKTMLGCELQDARSNEGNAREIPTEALIADD